MTVAERRRDRRGRERRNSSANSTGQHLFLTFFQEKLFIPDLIFLLHFLPFSLSLSIFFTAWKTKLGFQGGLREKNQYKKKGQGKKRGTKF